jgi:hypothetical protein
MPVIYGLPIVGVLLILFVIVRDIARRDRERRLQRGRRVKVSGKTIGRSERSQMRENADSATVIDTFIRTGPQIPSPPDKGPR